MNQGYAYRERIGARAAGTTLLEYLEHRYSHTSRIEWARRILTGRVTLDGRPAEAGSPLRAGQRLVWNRPGWIEPEAPVGFALLHVDEDLIAVAKPSGLPTLPGGGFLENTLLARVRAFDPVATPLHRLGRFTSGLLLFGRSPRARRILCRDFRQGRIVKRYRALACGIPLQQEFDVRIPIGRVPYPPLGDLYAADDSGKPSRSRVRFLEASGADSLLEITIETGRPHQIRIHLAAAGHPLVGDPLYGSGGRPLRGTAALPGDPGYALHAHRLELSHPVSGERLVLQCIPPPPLRLRYEATP